jgi:hypothetical protein
MIVLTLMLAGAGLAHGPCAAQAPSRHTPVGDYLFDRKDIGAVFLTHVYEHDGEIYAMMDIYMHSILIVKDGKLVFEEYVKGWDPVRLHRLQSVSKGVTAMLTPRPVMPTSPGRPATS